MLGVTARAPTLAEARRRRLPAAGAVGWDGVHYRRDIAEQAAAQVGAGGGPR